MAVQPKRVILDATSDEVKLHGKSGGRGGLLEVRGASRACGVVF